MNLENQEHAESNPNENENSTRLNSVNIENGFLPNTNENNLKLTNDKPVERDQWRCPLDFLVACLGFSIGLGNVWRFPYLCYKNGGGAFLFPYFISVLLAGIPLFYLEVSMGQFMSLGAIKVWDMCPLFRGIGFGCTLINFLLSCYYTVIIAWSFHYLISSFTSELPWTTCGNYWNTNMCRTLNMTENITDNSNLTDPIVEYWERRVLRLSDGIDSIGIIQWDLALCLLLFWIIIYLCICKGISTSRIVMYITAILPYIFMIALLIRTVMLEGALTGLTYYLSPNWAKLFDIEVWSDAGTQIFFSYSIGLGVLNALGSYNKRNHNSLRDCFIFAATNSLTSLLAGCVIFATLGYMSVTSNVHISKVAESGPGLAFIIYPKALSTIPKSSIWSCFFFIMLIFLGIDSMFAGVEGFIAAIADYFPRIFNVLKFRLLFAALVCVISYLIGLSMVTNGGMYIFQLFDNYSGSRIIVVIGFLETVIIGYVYGCNRFNKDIKSMYGISLGWLTKVCWCFITPLFTFALFVFSVMAYEELKYRRGGNKEVYQFPDWSVKVGWLMASTSLFFVPIVMIVEIYRTPGTLIERIKFLCKPKLGDRPVLVSELPDFVKQKDCYISTLDTVNPEIATVELLEVKHSSE